MTSELDQAAHDDWQTALIEASHRYSVALRDLHDTNPWPDVPVLANAINTLGTELWDRCFSLAEITSAFKDVVADLPLYAAGDEARP